jgi:hypothetical protein
MIYYNLRSLKSWALWGCHITPRDSARFSIVAAKVDSGETKVARSAGSRMSLAK